MGGCKGGGFVGGCGKGGGFVGGCGKGGGFVGGNEGGGFVGGCGKGGGESEVRARERKGRGVRVGGEKGRNVGRRKRG